MKVTIYYCIIIMNTDYNDLLICITDNKYVHSLFNINKATFSNGAYLQVHMSVENVSVHVMSNKYFHSWQLYIGICPWLIVMNKHRPTWNVNVTCNMWITSMRNQAQAYRDHSLLMSKQKQHSSGLRIFYAIHFYRLRWERVLRNFIETILSCDRIYLRM